MSVKEQTRSSRSLSTVVATKCAHVPDWTDIDSIGCVDDASKQSAARIARTPTLSELSELWPKYRTDWLD
jgi:hypothetical protein